MSMAQSGNTDIWIDPSPAHWSNAYDFPARHTGQVIQEDIRHGRVEKMWGFIFNSQRPPFDNRDVRRALSLAVDYE